jgi:ribosomal protein S18 acetylase RimI-like enzyme
MELRPLIPHDREKILSLLRHRGVFSKQEIQVALEVIDEALRHPEKKEYQVFCAFDGDGDLAGYICFGPVPMTDDRYDLYWIVVDEESSRKGVGGELIGFMEAFLAREGARRIYIDTSSSPPYASARSFYEKHGYQVMCTLKDFYRSGDHKMIFMKEVRCLAMEKGQISFPEKGLLCHQ